MGASLGTSGGKGSVDVELNIVPFIDLMSVLASFLLATAVWVDNSQLDIKPRGKNRESQPIEQIEDRQTLSILIQSDRIWIGVTGGDFQTVDKGSGGDFDWDDFEAKLKAHKESVYFSDRTDLEIAAESTDTAKVSYQDLIAAMDRAKAVGFVDPGISDPAGLSVRPQL